MLYKNDLWGDEMFIPHRGGAMYLTNSHRQLLALSPRIGPPDEQPSGDEARR